MTTTIVFGLTTDAYITSFSNNYNTSRAGTGSRILSDTSDLRTGQAGGLTFNIRESFIAFDVGAADLGDGEITDVDLVLHQRGGFVDTAFDVEAREYDWGASVTTDDWVPGANLGSLNLLATLTATTQSNTLRTFTPAGSALIDHVEAHRNGVSRMLLNSSRHRLGNTPSGEEEANFSSANSSGTTRDPRLVIQQPEEYDTDGTLGLTLGISGTARKISHSSGALALDLAASDDATKTGQTEATIDTDLSIDGTTAKTGAASGAVALDVAVDAEALAHKLTVGTLNLDLDIAGTADAGGPSGIIALVLDIAATAVKRAEATGTVALVLDIAGTLPQTVQLDPARTIDRGYPLIPTKVVQLGAAHTIDRGRPLAATKAAQLGAALVIDRGCSLTATKAALLDPARTVDRGRPLAVQLFMRRARLPVTGFELTHPGDRTIDLPLEVSPIGNQFELT